MRDYDLRLTALTPERHRLLEQQLKHRQSNERGVTSPAHTSTEATALPVPFSQTTGVETTETRQETTGKQKPLQFSLIFFSDDSSQRTANKYDAMFQAARYADQNGFDAVWIPERHLHPFGGLYPNPAVLGAALAMTTQHIQIRAGSVVLPLHHPLRAAEEWAVVDNLSGGRVGLSFASGWVPNDFILARKPFQQRCESFFEDVANFTCLWQGESVPFFTPEQIQVEARAFPAPLQAELPIWITSFGNPDTWLHAAETGANVLTALLQQSIEEIEERVVAYRAARVQHGFDPAEGIVTLMLHTFVWNDATLVYQRVRDPLLAYMQTHMDISKQVARTTGAGQAIEQLMDDDRLALADFAFQKYFHQNGLFGTPQSCQPMLDRLQSIGVNEIACLMDFGIDTDTLLESLQYVNQLREYHQQSNK